MKPARVLPRSLLLLLCLSFISCSDDDGPSGSGGGVDAEVAAARSMVYEVALPLLRDLFLGSYLAKQEPGAAVAKGNCTPIEACSSGSGEYCVNLESFDISFTQCQIGQSTLSGSVSFSGTADSGSGTVALTLGDISVEGDIAYEQSEGCFGQYFTNFEITTSTRTITMAGGSSWCEPYTEMGGVIIPSFANFEFIVPSLNRLIDVALMSDPPGQLSVLVMNPTRTETYKVCDGTLIGGSLSCYAGPDA